MRLTLATATFLWLALTLAAVAPGGANSVNLGIQIGEPPPPPPPVVVVPAAPLVLVPGTPVYYAPSLSINFFFYGGRYYTFYDGAWFYATRYHGPWIFTPVRAVPPPVLAVPVQYYRIPPGHWKKAGPPPWAGPKHGQGKWQHDD